MMKELMEIGNRYAKQSTWKDYALVKVCIGSLGILMGTRIAPKHKKAVNVIAGIAFAATYVPLMEKVLRIAAEEDHKE